MRILELELENIRNFDYLKIDLDAPLVVFYGENTAGKTNLIEAIYFLALTKSSRKGQDKDVILQGKNEARIKGIFQTEEKEDLKIEFIFNPKKIGKVDNVITKMKDILGRAGTVFFTVEDLDIIDDAQKKRRFLNILISFLDKKYFLNFISYQKILKRRNKALMNIKLGKGTVSELDFWDEKLAQLGEEIIKKRQETIEKINGLFEASSLFFANSPLAVNYKPSCPTKEAILEGLKNNLNRDLNLGQTTVGPHRDNIYFETKGMDLALYGSRGEKRTAALELKKAELELIKAEKKLTPILLLDDVFSELDQKNQENVLKLIKEQQTVLTSTSLDNVKSIAKHAKIYKLKNGTISKN